MKNGIIKRGDILLANLNPIRGSEQGNIRPVLVVQNNVSNEYSPTLIITPFTSKLQTKIHITNVPVSIKESRLQKDSSILCNQIRTIDKSRVIKKVSSLDNEVMKRVDLALKRSLGLD